MDNYLKDGLIIIGPSYLRKFVISNNKLNYSIKYIDEYEIIDKYIYEYKDDVLNYMDKKYNLIPEVSKIILDNLYDVDILKEYETDKLKNLVSIKKDLIENKYIKFNKNIKNYLNNKDILVIDEIYDNKVLKVIDELKKYNNVTYYKDEINIKDSIDIYEFNNIEDEISFVASKIVELVNNGIDINKIKINTIGSDYLVPIIKIFDFYNIPHNFKKNSLYSLYDIKQFLKLLNDDTKILDINDILDDLEIDLKLKEKLINIFNKYIDCELYKNIKEEIIYELKNTSISLKKYSNVVEEINYKNYLVTSDEYIFIMGLNQDRIPVIHKDDNYLSDKELEIINSKTSFKKNEEENIILKNFINKTKNIFISYKLKSSFNEYTASSFIKKMDNVNVIKKEYEFNNDKINKIILASKLDNYIKYNEESDKLKELLYGYNDNLYRSYDNSYNKISLNTLKKQLDNKINLSYTNTNTFFRCKFRFLLDAIYKLSTYEETLSQKIGNLFHDALCIIYKDKKDYNLVIDEVIDKYFSNPTNKEKFYVKKYKVALQNLLNVLDEQLSKTDYENTYFEEWFSVDKTNDLEFKIVGKIDKILTLKDDINTYVIVIDYKTGSMNSDFNKVIHGFDMQLLYYLYLIKNTSKISNPKFSGMYLQSIMTEVLNSEKNKIYEDLVKNNMKLFGYTIDDVDKVKFIDKEYDINSYIQSLKVKNDGSFYSYSKVLSEETIDKLIDIVEDNLNEVIKSIKECSFEINPKKLGNALVGCEYCGFKDICYMNNDDVVDLVSYKDLEFLRGDNDDTN